MSGAAGLEERVDWPASVAIVGAGIMGVGIAQVFAGNGIPTALVDLSVARAEEGRARGLELLARLEADAAVETGATDRARRALSVAASIAEGVAGVGLVIEAVVERTDVKRQVHADIEAAARPDATIATNTSSIPISELGATLARPERFLGVHWFVPALLIPGVEVIPSAATDESVITRIVSTLARLGKRPVVVGDGPGFVANRIQFAMFREAARIVAEGLASASDVDEIVRSSFGFRLPFFGPFSIADMAGLDVYADIFATLEHGLGPDFSAPPALLELVGRGAHGVKTGRGFHDAHNEDGEDLVVTRDRAFSALMRIRSEIEG